MHYHYKFYILITLILNFLNFESWFYWSLFDTFMICMVDIFVIMILGIVIIKFIKMDWFFSYNLRFYEVTLSFWNYYSKWINLHLNLFYSFLFVGIGHFISFYCESFTNLLDKYWTINLLDRDWIINLLDRDWTMLLFCSVNFVYNCVIIIFH